jgi:hypothetical protein
MMMKFLMTPGTALSMLKRKSPVQMTCRLFTRTLQPLYTWARTALSVLKREGPMPATRRLFTAALQLPHPCVTRWRGDCWQVTCIGRNLKGCVCVRARARVRACVPG